MTCGPRTTSIITEEFSLGLSVPIKQSSSNSEVANFSANETKPSRSLWWVSRWPFTQRPGKGCGGQTEVVRREVSDTEPLFKTRNKSMTTPLRMNCTTGR